MICINPRHLTLDRKNPDAVMRGLCSGCYAAANRRVQAGKATWQALEDRGRVLSIADDPSLASWFDINVTFRENRHTSKGNETKESILQTIEFMGAMGARELTKTLKIPRRTVAHHITTLIDEKKLKSTGFGRATKYILADKHIDDSQTGEVT